MRAVPENWPAINIKKKEKVNFFWSVLLKISIFTAEAKQKAKFSLHKPCTAANCNGAFQRGHPLIVKGPRLLNEH